MKNYLEKELYELVKNDSSIFDFIQKGSLDGIWYWDLEKPENEWMSEKFWTEFGYDPLTMPHKSDAWHDIINKDDLQVAIDNFNKYLKGPAHSYDQTVRYTHKNGSTVWIRCRGIAIRDQNGKPIRMLGAHNNISEAMKYVNIQEENKKLEELNTKLLLKNKELSRFTYIASHDLQEPLNTIIGFSEILKNNYSEKFDGIGLQSLDIINSSTNRIKTLVSDLLGYSRIGTNQKTETVNVNELLEDIRTDLTSLINKNEVVFIYNDLLEIQAFKNELRILFLNLITNAIKYRKEKESPIIEIRVEETLEEYKYSVIDNGIGIDMQFKDKIFEVFCRLHTKDQYSGTGIGLANCFRAAEIHKGKIWLESTENNGSMFTFTIKKGLNND